MSSQIKPNTLIKIYDLFSSKKWSTEVGDAENLSLFDKFCERLKLFNNEHQEFIIELTENFMKISLNDYLERFYESMLCVEDRILYDKHKIFIYPLIDPFVAIPKKKEWVYRGKTKSANFLHYMIECDDYTWISKNIIVDSSIKRLNEEFKNEDSYLFLIDDYIGSGETASDICKIFLDEKLVNIKIDKENIKVISIAAQQQGIEKIKNDWGVTVYSNIIRNRGITDNYYGDALIQNTNKMIDIGRKLDIDESIFLGYEKTEALITFMNKTPNNTFPVYWHETKRKVAPFPRYKNFVNHG